MQKVVLFTGPDRNGKSTMAKELSRRLGIPYFKNVAEKDAFLKGDSDYFVNTVRYAEPFFIDYLCQSQASLVLDRGYVDEWVYSRLFGRITDHQALKWVDERYSKLGLKIVIPVRSSYLGRHDDDSSGMIDDKKMEETDRLYRKFFEWTECDVLILNVDDENLDREIDEITQFLEGTNK